METIGKKYAWDKFNYADWKNDMALQHCSLSARGLWIELLGLMFASEEVGYLLIAGRPWTTQEIAKDVNARPSSVAKLLEELQNMKVFSVREQDGAIYSRRMTRAYQERIKSFENGKKGGNPVLKVHKTIEQAQEKVIKTEEKAQEPKDHIGANQPQNEGEGLTLDIRDKNKEIRGKSTSPYSPPKEGGLIEGELTAFKPQRKTRPTPLSTTEPLPDWMPMEAWNGYLEMRAARKKSPTAYAIRNIICKLDAFRQKGHAVKDILDKSTEECWTGIFEPKPSRAALAPVNQSNRPKSQYEVVDELEREWGLGPYRKPNKTPDEIVIEGRVLQ